MNVIIPALLVSAFFYILFPLIGAFAVRHRWRIFRKKTIKASLAKEISYSNINNIDANKNELFCFTGELQAIQEDNYIWLNNGKISVRVEMAEVKTYILPTSEAIDNEKNIEENKTMLPGDMPKKLAWNKLYSIEQGTKFFVYGKISLDGGSPVFKNSDETSLFVIIYDGKKETILRRLIWSGRQINEYWHNVTPFSLIAGSFFLFVLSYSQFKAPGYNFNAIISLVFSFLPIIPFFPPGIIFYFLFKRFWRNARYLRGDRDLLKLPLRLSNYEKMSNCKIALEKYKDAKIRSCGLLKENELLNRECRVFGYLQTNKAIPDFFKEKLIIPGDPARLAHSCRKRARVFEFLAMAFFAVGFVINVSIVFIALYFIL